MYIESNDKKLSLKAEIINGSLHETWYFNGFEKTASDLQLQMPFAQFVPSSLIVAKSYNGGDGEFDGCIGFYNRGVRSWTTALTKTKSGTFWATVYLVDGALDPNKSTVTINNTTVQSEPYEAPSES